MRCMKEQMQQRVNLNSKRGKMMSNLKLSALMKILIGTVFFIAATWTTGLSIRAPPDHEEVPIAGEFIRVSDYKNIRNSIQKIKKRGGIK